MCALQEPIVVLGIFLFVCPTGNALSGIVSPKTPATYSTLKPVSEAAKDMESRLSLRAGMFKAKTFWNYLEVPSR